MRRCSLLAVLAAVLAGAPPASSTPAVGVIDDSGVLVTFDTASPAALTSARTITGLNPGERVAGLDYRYFPLSPDIATPAGLFGIGVVDAGATDQVRLLRIDIGTGVATPVAAPITLTSGSGYGMDFNPTSDRVRVVNSGDENARINPNNGARSDAPANDTDLNPAAQLIPAVAYDRPQIPPTQPVTAANSTAFLIQPPVSQRLTLGGVNQSPNPNAGQLMNGVPLGIPVDATALELVNLDIDLNANTYATARVGGLANLYTLNAAGAATLVGALAAPLRAFAIAPASTAALADPALTAAEGQAAAVNVTRGGATTSTLTVNYTTTAGTASTADYSPVAGALTFAPGETTKSFTIPTTADATDEPDETVGYALSAAGTGGRLGTAAGTLTIADDDPTPPVVDRTAPRVTVTGLRTAVTRSQFLRGVTFRVTPSEASSLTAELYGSVTSARISAFELRLATRSLRRAAGRRTITLRPSRRLVGAPRRRVRVRLAVTARDAAGNTRRTTRTITVRPR